jgi:hypothetical protein
MVDRWTDDAILSAIRLFDTRHGRPPTTTDWSPAAASSSGRMPHPDDGPGDCPSPHTVRRAFGSFPAAVRAAGLEPARTGGSVRWSRARVLAALRDFADCHGRPPTSREWARACLSHPSSATVRKRFGSFSEAVRAAGLGSDPVLPREPSRLRRRWDGHAIVAALRSDAEQRGRAPTYAAWKRAAQDHPRARTVERVFGSWGAALVAARLAPNRAGPNPGEGGRPKRG